MVLDQSVNHLLIETLVRINQNRVTNPSPGNLDECCHVYKINITKVTSLLIGLIT